MKKKKNSLTPFGKAIKKKAVEKGITLVELATILGTTKQYLNNIMYGTRSGEKYVDHICKIMELDQSQSKRIKKGRAS